MNGCTKMRTDDFDYNLPEELIAQEPLKNRSESRMMVVDPLTGTCKIHTFSDLPDFMQQGDVVAVNDTKVIRARLFAMKETGARIEIFLLGLKNAQDGKTWNCFMKPAKRVTPGTSLQLYCYDGINFSGKSILLLEKRDDGVCTVQFEDDDVDQTLRLCGHLPLPPYIHRKDQDLDSERYQTVYARTPGAVAAPTAGLHFTPEIFRKLQDKGVRQAKLTLHVGAGTFQPVSATEIKDHKMHTEMYFLPQSTAGELNEARRNGHRILAVGTTSLRTLETCVKPDGLFDAAEGSTDIFIYPPRKVLSADMLLTNFHLPKSTLLMLVSAFAGTDLIREAYQLAIRERMRFFSYGDCMLILNRVQ